MATNTDGGTTTSLNNTPQAKDDLYTAKEDEVLYFSVMDNDLGGAAKVLWSVDNTSDDGSTDLVAKDVAGVCEYSELGAKISLTSDGRIRYDTTLLDALAAGETVIDQFTYAIRMSNGTLSWATVTVTLSGTNDGPVAVDDVASVNEDASTSGNVGTNDSDVDNGAVLGYALVDPAPTGLTFNPDGSWTFDASSYDSLAEGEEQVLVIPYTVTDEHGEADTGELKITITGTNDGPVANADSDTTGENAVLTVDVLANDTDVDNGAVLTVTAANAPAGQGSASIVGNQVQFDPGTDFDYLAVGESTEVVVNYTIEDEHGASSSSTLTITVTGTNDGPDAVADTDTTDEDTSILVDVLANDTDPDTSDVLSISDADVTTGLGTVAIESGQLRYDPGSAYNYLAVGESEEVVITYSISDGNGGSDSATLTITVTGTNDGPDAVADTDTTDEDTSILVDVLANDTDPDTSDVLSISDADVTSGLGTVAIESGQLRYDPGAAYNYLAVGESEEVVITYSISDGNGGSDSATLTITVTGTNDGPDAVADTDTTDEDTSILVDVLANDTDPDTSDVLSISDADVTSGLGTVAIESGQLRYDPGAAYNYLAVGESEEVVITYSISDGNGGSDSATLTITVTGTNDGPDAVADTDTTDEDTSILVDVLANDTDPDTSDVLSISDADVTSGLGSVAIESGQLRYDPGAAYNYLAVGESEEVVITYSISDGNGGSDSATLTITVTGTNDGPDAVADTDTTDEDTSILVDVLANDTDPDTSDVLSISDADVTSGLGTVAIESGQLRYDPGAAYNYLAVGESEEVVITYSISDGNGGSDSATLTITVTGTNDGPDAVADTDTTDEDTSILVDVLANDTDPDTSDVLSISDADVTTGLGSVAIESGQLRYDPGAAYNYLAVGESEEVVITYSISDGNGGSDSATLTITVTGTNDTPELTAAQAVLAGGTEDTDYDVTTAQLLTGFSDPDSSDVLAVFGLTADHGTVVQNLDGSYTIQPEADYNGPVVLSYSVIDGNGGSVPATLSFNLAPVNDAAVISGTTSGSVLEATPADPGTPTATGSLLASDVDNPPNTFIAQGSTVTASGYGSFTMSAGGVWTYTLNNGNAAVNALAAGMFLIDTFTVQSADGTTQTITVTIDGATDAIVVTPPPTENGADPNDFDTLTGGFTVSGNHTATNGDDTFTGDGGNQTLNGQGGNDTIYAAGGNDSVNGNNDNDTLYGQAGIDTVSGNNGLDTLYGGSGNDILTGGNDGDTIYGGSGDDSINGSGGNDIIIGGYGADTIAGDIGDDTFRYLSTLDTNDTITDFMTGNDQIDLLLIDALPGGADDAFAWGGMTPTANGLWFSYDAGTNTTTLFGDTDGNAATAEFMLTLENYNGFNPFNNPLTPPPDITY